MRFASPYWLILLTIVPALALFYMRAMHRRGEALNRLTSSRLRNTLVSIPSKRKRWTSYVLILTGLFSIVTALARPQFGQRAEEKERKGLDIEFMIDSSLSMAAVDAASDRFEAAKEAVRDIMKRLKGDRVGLTLFTNAPLRILPFTTDYGSMDYYLKICDMKVFLNHGTNIEAAVKGTIPVFEKKGSKSKVMVLLSDGEDEPGLIYRLPEEFIASDIHLYAFGIGTEGGGSIPLRSETEKVVGYMKDSGGRDIVTRLEELSLKEIAQGYNGKYYRYSQKGIDDFVGDLESLKKEMIEEKESLVYDDYFQYFLLAGFLIIFLAKAVLED